MGGSREIEKRVSFLRHCNYYKGFKVDIVGVICVTGVKKFEEGSSNEASARGFEERKS